MKPMEYRKKPVVITALQFVYSKEGIDAMKDFVGAAMGAVQKARHPTAKAEFQILTLEDGKALQVAHIATEGDYIIKGVRGEFYACKPDIFAATYEMEPPF